MAPTTAAPMMSHSSEPPLGSTPPSSPVATRPSVVKASLGSVQVTVLPLTVDDPLWVSTLPGKVTENLKWSMLDAELALPAWVPLTLKV